MYMKSHLLLLRLFLLLAVLLPSHRAISQEAYRVKADFSIKSKGDTVQSLTMGTVYYDKNIKKVVYLITFPQPQTWVQKDSMLFKIESGKISDTTKVPFLSELTLFHLALNGQLPDYGLKGTPYELEKVEKDGDLVIKTFAPPVKFQKELGKVLISNKERRLHGIVFLKADGGVMSKQFFEDYSVSKGVAFPTRVVQITTSAKGTDMYQVTTYRNIIIDGKGEDNIYNYPLRTR